jgi:hypothetical protein
MRRQSWIAAAANAAMNLVLFALACVILYACAKALFELLNIVLSFVG